MTVQKYGFASILVLLVSLNVHGQTVYTWTGAATGGNFSASTWSPGLPPLSSSVQLLFNSSSSMTFAQDQYATMQLNKLTVNTSTGIDFTLTFNGLNFLTTSGITPVIDWRSNFAMNLNVQTTITNNLQILYGGSNSTVNFGGIVSGAGAITMGSFTNSGSGTGFTAVNTYTGAITAYGTGLYVTGANGSLSSASSITLFGTTLYLDNQSGAPNSNRVNNTINLHASSIALVNFTSGQITESYGSLSLLTGVNIITYNGSSSAMQFNATGALNRSPGTFLQIVNPTLTLGGPQTTTTNQLKFTTAPTLIGGGGIAGTPTISILPYAYMSNQQFLTHDANGLRPLAANETTATLGANNGTATWNNYLVNASISGFTGTTEVGSLTFTSGTLSGAGTIKVRSGGITGSSGTISVGTLDFGTTEGLISSTSSITINSIIAGSAGLSLGGSTITLNALNTYTGGTIIAATVRFTQDQNLSTGIVTIAGGTLNFNGPLANYTSSRDYTMGPNGGQFSNSSGATLILSGIISGGPLSISNGVVQLSGNSNTYTGATKLVGGTLQISSETPLGAAGVPILSSNGTLQAMAGFTLTRPIINGLRIDTNGFNVSVSGALTGTGSFVKSGSGTLTINSGTNTFAGPVTVSGGSLLLNSMPQVTSGLLIISNNATLIPPANLVFTTSLNLNATSSGVIAFQQPTSSETIDFSYLNTTISGATGVSLGTILTPTIWFGGISGSATTFRLGGGGGELVVASSISFNGSVLIRDPSLANSKVTFGASNLSWTSLTIEPSGTLQFNVYTTYAGNGFTNNGKLLLAAAGTYRNVSGVGSVTTSNSGIILSNNTYTGTTTASTNDTLTISGTSYSRTLKANAPATITFSNAIVYDATIRGPGVFTVSGTSNTFDLVTFSQDVGLNQNVPATFTNVAMNGILTNNALLFWDGGSIGPSGALTVNNSINAFVISSLGTITMNAGSNVQSFYGMTLGGGSRTFIATVGNATSTSINLNGGTLTVAGGFLVNNGGDFASGGGIRGGQVIVDFGGKAKGAGYYQSVITQNGGIFSPGNSPGNAQIGVTAINPGGILNIDIDAAGPNGTNGVGIAGGTPGWGRVQSLAELRITATTDTKFTITLTSQQLGASGVTGPVSNFDATKPHHWEVIQMQPTTRLYDVNTGGTANDPSTYIWDPSKVTIDSSAFQNSLAGGSFTTSFELNELGAYSVYVNFTPVPEPTTIFAFAAASLLLARRMRNSRMWVTARQPELAS